MDMTTGHVVLTIFCLVVQVCGFLYDSPKLHYVSLEAETQARDLTVTYRSNASDNTAVLLKPGDALRLDMCLVYSGSVRIMGVFYSSDGRETRVEVSLDGLPIGNFKSSVQLDKGKSWNEFHSTGPVGILMKLDSGPHYVELRVAPEQIAGIEIDRIDIGTTDKYTTRDILSCQLSCMCELDDIEVHMPEGEVAPAKFIQRSLPTECAEQSNVDIALVHPTIQSYRLTSFYPKYNSMLNYHNSDFQNCEDLSPKLLWMITDDSINTEYNVITDIRSMKLDLNPTEPLKVEIAFPLKGKTEGSINADIGSEFEIKFKEITYDLSVNMTFKGKHTYFTSAGVKSLTKTNLIAEWSIPDYTWSDYDFNDITLLFSTRESQQVVIDFISLSRRDEKGETGTTLYEDADTAIDGVNVDFWWRRPNTMTVTIEGNKEVFKDIDYIRLRKRVLGTNSTSHIFVLYQDGHSRSLPPLIHGVDWIPFGSSVIIGPSDLQCLKPSADIEAIHIQQVAPNLIFHITYYDGSNASVEVCTRALQTEVCVYDIYMTGNRTETPFARFRSMWVTNGNCDVDHYKTNGVKGQPILTDWNNLESTWAKFYRSCESKHLNKSPDMCIELVQ